MDQIIYQSEGHTLQGAFYEGAQRPGFEHDRHAAAHRQANTSAVILCHGAFEDSQNWSAYAERLAHQGFSTLVLEFAGHGESGGQRGLVDLRHWAYNIRDAMNALGERGYLRFALVGWGNGGTAALLTAAHDRRLVCAAVLAAPVQMMPSVGERAAYSLAAGASKLWKAIKKRPLTLSRLQELEKLRFAVNSQADEEYKANPHWRETLQAVPIPESLDSVWVDITQAVVKIKTPVLILHGLDDKVVPVKQSQKLYALLPGKKKLCLIEDSGHALHLDQKKEEVYIQIARWIKHYLNA